MRKNFFEDDTSTPALEAIAFQNPIVFKELTAAYKALEGVNAADIAGDPLLQTVTGIIEHHTGISLIPDTTEFGSGPAVQIPSLNRNNILVESIYRNYISSADGLKMINDADGVARGTVSLRQAKVTGIFTDLKARLFMPASFIADKKFTPEEKAAVTLHEVGHIFTYFEYICRTVKTNQAMAGVAKALDGTNTVDEREAVLITMKRKFNLKDLDTKTLAKSNDKRVAEVVLISNIIMEARDELGANIYNTTSFEYLSDDFAARMGAGAYLATALDKIFRSHHHISYRSGPTYIAVEAIKLGFLLSPLWAPHAIVTRLAISASLSMLAMDGNGDNTYDRPGARMTRIRNTLMEALKDKTLSDEERKEYETDIETVDDISKSINDRRQWLGAMWDFIWPGARKARTQEKLQQDLEELARNDLFLKSSQLREITN